MTFYIPCRLITRTIGAQHIWLSLFPPRNRSISFKKKSFPPEKSESSPSPSPKTYKKQSFYLLKSILYSVLKVLFLHHSMLCLEMQEIVVYCEEKFRLSEPATRTAQPNGTVCNVVYRRWGCRLGEAR